MSFNQALQMIEKNGGQVSENEVTIKCQNPVAVRFEKSFEGTYLVKKTPYNKDIIEAGAIEIDGNGVVFKGRVRYADQIVKTIVLLCSGNTKFLKVNTPLLSNG